MHLLGIIMIVILGLVFIFIYNRVSLWDEQNERKRKNEMEQDERTAMSMRGFRIKL